MAKRPITITYSPPVRTIVVAGGVGFIGSALCRLLIRDGALRVINIDSMTSVVPSDATAMLADAANYRFVQGDVSDRALVEHILREERVDAVVNLTADRSVGDPARLIQTNIVGTFALLESALSYWRDLLPDARQRFRFVQVSAPDVFGDVPADRGRHHETAPYLPASAFAASMAAADHLVRAWHRQFGLPAIVSIASNTYGPYQSPDELIPRVIRNALAAQPVPVCGAGDECAWLHVDDHANALRVLLARGQPGEAYLVGAREAYSTISLVGKICDLIDQVDPLASGRRRRSLISFVADHLERYRGSALDPSHIERSLGWRAQIGLVDGLLDLIDRERAIAGWPLVSTAALASTRN